jgi:hypothetical protein
MKLLEEALSLLVGHFKGSVSNPGTVRVLADVFSKNP